MSEFHKRQLTPSSKVLPNPKRLHLSSSPAASALHTDKLSSTKTNKSGQQAIQLQWYLKQALKANFAVYEGSTLSRRDIADEVSKWLKEVFLSNYL